MKVEEDAEKAATVAFMSAPIRRKRKRRLARSSSKSSASGFSDSKESDSSDNFSKGFLNDFDSGDGEGEEEMEYQAPDYP